MDDQLDKIQRRKAEASKTKVSDDAEQSASKKKKTATSAPPLTLQDKKEVFAKTGRDAETGKIIDPKKVKQEPGKEKPSKKPIADQSLSKPKPKQKAAALTSVKDEDLESGIDFDDGDGDDDEQESAKHSPGSSATDEHPDHDNEQAQSRYSQKETRAGDSYLDVWYKVLERLCNCFKVGSNFLEVAHVQYQGPEGYLGHMRRL